MPALVTFHERLFDTDLLPAAIRSALALTNAEAVYDARRPRAIKQGTEVVLTRLAPVYRSRGGAHQVTEHRYAVSVRIRGLGDGAQTGKPQADAVDAHLWALREGFDSARPFVDELDGDLLSTRFEILEQDVAPAEKGAIEGRGLLSFFTRGSGALDGAAAPGG